MNSGTGEDMVMTDSIDTTQGTNDLMEITFVLPKSTLGAINHYIDIGMYANEQQAFDLAGGLLLWASAVIQEGNEVAMFDCRRNEVTPIQFLNEIVLQKFRTDIVKTISKHKQRPHLSVVVNNT